MKKEDKFKYISKTNISQLNSEPNKDKTFGRNFLGFLDKLLFKDPFKTFSMLIMLVAFPISVYVTIRQESINITSQADNSNISLESTEESSLTEGVEYSLKFEARSENTNKIKLNELTSPDWMKGSSPTVGGSKDSYYAIANYSGVPPKDSSDNISVLAEAQKTTDYQLCNGCDKDNDTVYSLKEKNLSLKNCTQKNVWGRNPIGSSYNKSVENNCEEFSYDCRVPNSWRGFTTRDACIQADNSPEFVSFPEDITVEFNTNCKGEYIEKVEKIDNLVEAKDQDGDLVRFSLTSPDDFLNLKQDTYKSIVDEVVSNSSNYFNKIYSSFIKGEVSKDMIGNSYPIKVQACDMTQNCSEKLIQLHVIERDTCEKLSALAVNNQVNISYPSENDEFSWVNNIIYEMSGSEFYDVTVNLYESNCSTKIAQIAKYEKLEVDPDKGYTTSLDSRPYEDGNYCVGVLIGNGVNNYSDFNKFSILNDSEPPVITSTPGKTKLKTGESFSYKVTAEDPDGDTINYDVVGLPDWLTFKNQTISGSTVVPGLYNFVIWVDDFHENYDSQAVSLTVLPPENKEAEIKFIYPQKDSVLSGEENNIRWEASDNEGIKEIRLYYSEDGEKWILIKNYGPKVRNANWDVSDLENGDYFLQLVVVDKSDKNAKTGLISEKFYITNEKDEPEGPIEKEDNSMPAIKNLNPKPDSETMSTKPLISASYTASNDAEIVVDKVEVILDDNSIVSLCEVNKNDLSCQLDEDLEIGAHKVEITVYDTKDKSISEEWIFEIIEDTIVEEEPDEDKDEEETVSEDCVNIPIANSCVSESLLSTIGIICCASVLLILIPWLIYYIWTKRNSKIESDNLYDKGSSDESGNSASMYADNSYYQPSYPNNGAPSVDDQQQQVSSNANEQNNLQPTQGVPYNSNQVQTYDNQQAQASKNQVSENSTEPVNTPPYNENLQQDTGSSNNFPMPNNNQISSNPSAENDSGSSPQFPKNDSDVQNGAQIHDAPNSPKTTY